MIVEAVSSLRKPVPETSDAVTTTPDPESGLLPESTNRTIGCGLNEVSS